MSLEFVPFLHCSENHEFVQSDLLFDLVTVRFGETIVCHRLMLLNSNVVSDIYV